MAKKYGTIKGRYVPTQPNFWYHRYCGIINTCAGSIMDSSMAVNRIFFPLNWNLANPYATSEEAMTVPKVATTEITREFIKQLENLTIQNPFQPRT